MPEQPMKIVEALKRLRIIEKKIASNCTEVTKYSAIVSSQKPLFESADRQRKEVESITQSSMDLVTEYLRLKRRLDLTNLNVMVTINGDSRTIAEWLIVKRKIADLVIAIWNAQNDSSAQTARRDERMYGTSGQSTNIDRFYSEEEKNNMLRRWHDLKAAIDGRLEVVNATTDLHA